MKPRRVEICIKAEEGSFTIKHTINSQKSSEFAEIFFGVLGETVDNQNFYIMSEGIRERAIELTQIYSQSVPIVNKFRSFITSVPTFNQINSIG